MEPRKDWYTGVDVCVSREGGLKANVEQVLRRASSRQENDAVEVQKGKSRVGVERGGRPCQ